MVAESARRYWLIWAAVIPIAIWAMARVLELERGFPFVALMAYTPYVAIVALLVFGVAVALRNWTASAVAAVAAACLLAAVLPRAISDGTAHASGHRELRVLSTNIHLGSADVDELVAMVARFRPDLLNVQELTPGFASKLDEAGIERLLPYATLSLRWRKSGGGIYSRFPIRRLGQGQRFDLRMPRAAIELPGGSTIRVVDVHPHTPKRRSVGLWQAGLLTLPSAGRGDPWILAGDFNATLDHEELRAVIDRGYRDAGDVTGRGLEATWPSDRLFPPPVTIDHILADKRLGILDYGVEDLSGTDHRTVHAVLTVP